MTKIDNPTKRKHLINSEFEKEISSSIDSIKRLKEETAFKTELEGFPIDNSISTSSKKVDQDFEIKFFIDKFLDGSYMSNFKKFGINEKIILNCNGRRYSINENTTKKVQVTLSSPKVITISVNNFQDQEDEHFDDKILRLVVPTEIEPNFGAFNCKSNKIADTTTFCGLIEVKLNEKSYHIFKHKNNDTKEKYIIIDSVENNKFTEFKDNTSAILLGFGFITGNLFQNEYYYQIIEKDYSTIAKATAYYKKEPSIVTNANLFNPMEFQQYLKHIKQEYLLEKVNLQLDSKVFSNICELISKNFTLSRCIKLIIEGNQTNLLLLKAGVYSIALETITSLISEENKARLKPIPNKSVSKIFVEKLKKVLEDNRTSISNYGFDILKSKIENINNPTNSRKLSIPFEIYNLKLSESELSILNHRNKFLHGTSPFEESELMDKDNEIAYISKKLLTLCNSLILKYCGYSGYMIDYGGYHQLNSENKLTEHLFKII